MPNLSTLSGSLKVTASGQGTKSFTGADYSALTQPFSIGKTVSLASTIANNAAGGADEVCSAITSIVAAGNASIDLTSLTDIIGQTGVSGARVKGILIRLLSTTDDATNGTACTSVTIDNTAVNSLSAQSHSGWFDNGSEGAAGGSKFTIANGDFLAWGTTSAGGVLIDSTHKLIHIVNNDGAHAAAVQVTVFIGTT